MKSYRLQRSMGGALVASVVVAGTVASVPAIADPTNATDALKQYQDLAHQAEVVNQQLLQANDALNARNADLARAQQTAAQAQAQEEKFRGQVDQFSRASYEGAQMSKLSALLVSQSPNEFLDRASTMEALSKDNAAAVHALMDATNKAKAAEQQAAQARDDAARIANDLHQKQGQLQAQADKLHEQYERLSASDLASLKAGTHVGLLSGSGAAIEAVNAALGVQGDPYVWGATGPNAFDCSGLMVWAYKQAGVSLPRTSEAQAEAGVAVSSQSDLQPGDLVIFYSDYSHVGMYVGGGQVVHAPEPGEGVKVTQIKYIGSVTAMRRVAG